MHKQYKGIGAIFLIGGVAILIVVTVVGLYLQKRSQNISVSSSTKTVLTNTTVGNEGDTTLNPDTSSIKASDATDARLDQDFVALDKSINDLSLDAALIDTGINDKMGDLSE